MPPEFEASLLGREPEDPERSSSQESSVAFNKLEKVIETLQKMSVEERIKVIRFLVQDDVTHRLQAALKDELDVVPDISIDKDAQIPVGVVSRLTGYSITRLDELLRTGRIAGERRKPRLTASWHTTLREVERYVMSLSSPSERGKQGANKRWRKDT